MIDRIVDFSATNRLAVLAVAAFLTVAGLDAMRHLQVDALPDLADPQVVVYSRWDRSADVIDRQVTHPISSALLGAPGIKAVRGMSDFGASYVYAVFEDGADIYQARARTLECLSPVVARFPPGVRTELGPSATSLSWIFQYALVDISGKSSLADLRAYQDRHLRYHLQAVPGVAEIASVGGFEKQYQVNVDPRRLRAYGVPMKAVVDAVRASGNEVSGGLLESAGAEYVVRSRGTIHSIQQLQDTVLIATSGSPVRVNDIGAVSLGPELRRGIAELDGVGEVVSGIVVMRQDANAQDVIRRIKTRLRELRPTLPAGLTIVPTYDRSELIQRAIDSLSLTLLEIAVTVALVILVFLRHLPSAAIPILTIPIVVLVSFVSFRFFGLTANIMSLGGVAIAVSVLVDAAIVVAEQAHKKLEEWNGSRAEPAAPVVLRAVREVARPSFFALLALAAALLPVLVLESAEGRLFKPFVMATVMTLVIAAVMTLTVDPALRMSMICTERVKIRPHWLAKALTLTLGRIQSEEGHPITRLLIRTYEPTARWALEHGRLVVAGAIALILATIPAYERLGAEFMPPLDEGALLYMPSTAPGIGVAEAQRLTQTVDRIIKGFPEVDRVLGKAGRAETATDPAPLSMLETTITLKPVSEWPRIDTWYSGWAPSWARPALRRLTPDHLSTQELVARLDAALQIPGVANAWTMPVRGRLDMQATGIRTSVGLKISGDDMNVIDQIGLELEALLTRVPGTRSVFADRSGDGRFVDIEWNRDALARHGLSIDDAQLAVASSIGGENIATAIEGRERYPVNVRYMRDFRSDVGALENVFVSGADGRRQLPLSDLAVVRRTTGPSTIRSEDGLPTGYVYIDLAARDPQSYIREADALIRMQMKPRPGYVVSWSGHYEGMARVASRLALIVPATMLLVALLMYLNTRSWTKVGIIALAVPFSAVGAIWLLYLLGYNMSVGVWVGLIALLGLDAQTGAFMLLYLDLSCDRAHRENRLNNVADLRRAIVEGAVTRLRPKFMTVTATLMGLVPIMWATATGSDVMKRIAAPIIGGIVTSFILELLVYPPLYETWKRRAFAQAAPHGGAPLQGE